MSGSQTAYPITSMLTLTRATTKWVFNLSGVLAQVAAGAFAFAYDPVTSAARGISIEESATNLLFPSADANAFFTTQVNTTVGGTPAVAPDGTSTMKQIIVSTAAGNHYVQHANWTVNAQQPMVFECWLKAGAFSQGVIAIIDGQVGANYSNTTFNLTTGTVSSVVGGSAVVMSSKLTPYSNGVYKLEIVTQPTTNTSQTTLTLQAVVLNNSGVQNFTGDGTSGYYIGGVSLKASSSPSSYIPTTTAAATRAADVVALTPLTLGNIVPSSFTEYVQFRIPNAAPAGKDQVLLHRDDGTTANVIEIVNPAGTTNISCQVTTAGATVFQGVGGTFTPGSVVMAALSCSPNQFAFSVNGGAPITGTTGTQPLGLTEGWLGSRSGASAFINGDFQDYLVYYPAVPASEMAALTANGGTLL